MSTSISSKEIIINGNKAKSYSLDVTPSIDCDKKKTHENSDLMMASLASARNLKRLLLDPQYSNHSIPTIVEFYRKATAHKKTDNTLNPKRIKTNNVSFSEDATLKKYEQADEYIYKSVNPLKAGATLQDIMRYYIDIYDANILKASELGIKIIPMNTGNPAFFPFAPIIKALEKVLHENLIAYAKYIMQVPELGFCKSITQYCHEEGILSTSTKLDTCNVVIGNGSTNLYYLALKSIIKSKGDIILITKPTYGLFIDPVFTAGGEIGFLEITERMAWKLQPKTLDETINFYNQKSFYGYILNSFVKKYLKLIHKLKLFNINENTLPAMPNIEKISDFKIFDDYIKKLNICIESINISIKDKIALGGPGNSPLLKFSLPPRVRGFYHMNPHNPTGAVYSKQDLEALALIFQKHPDIYVIDDLAHWGILYDSAKISSFSSFNHMFNRTLTLMSLSKSYSVPGLRAGVAIGPSEIIKEMQYGLLNSNSSASVPAVIALETVFSAPKMERDIYLKNNNLAYRFRRDLMMTLINGLKKTNLSFDEKMKICTVVIQNEYQKGKPFDRKLLKKVLSGMPLVRTLTEPKGCFFHLVDVSKFIGANVGSIHLGTATDVRNAIHSICGVDTVPGEISGNFLNYTLRMSFSLTEQQIYSACKNIHLFIVNYILKFNPSLAQKANFGVLQFKSSKEKAEEDCILNKAIISFYLDQARQALILKCDDMFKVNYLQNKERSQVFKKRISELNVLLETLFLKTNGPTIHNEIHRYIEENKIWLENLVSDFVQLKLINNEFLEVDQKDNQKSIKYPNSKPQLRSAL